MDFNNTSTRNGIIQSCEFWTGIGNSQISGDSTMLKEFTRLINANYHKIVTLILNSMDEWDFDDPNHDNTGFIKTYDITSGTQYVKLPLSDKILKIKRAEISYDGSTWYRLNPMDLNEYSGVSTSAQISANFSKTQPYYDVQGNYVYLYPIPDTTVSAGLKLWVTREVDEFTTADTTQEPGFDEPFHEMLALGASLDYAFAKSLSSLNVINTKYADYEERLKQYYGSKQKDRDIVLKAAFVDYE